MIKIADRKIKNSSLHFEISEKFKAWLYYFNFFYPGHPALGKPYIADCAIAQTFGREKIKDESLKYLFPLREQYLHCETKVFQHLMGNGFSTGKPNIELAKECIKKIEKYKIKVYAQWEVAFEIFNLDCQWYEKNTNYIIPIWPEKDAIGFNTFEVIQATKKLMEIDKKFTPLLIANSWMSIRVALMIKKVFGKLPIMTKASFQSFSPKSLQWWTRNYVSWIIRESLVRLIHHPLKRWV